MGRSTNFSGNQSSQKTPKEPHYIWRGIGCLMVLIIPTISIVAGNETVKYAVTNNWAIPYQLTLTVRLPKIFYATAGLRTIFEPLSDIPYLYLHIATSILYMVLISGFISVIYAAVYRMVGPERYGPTDAPPSKIKVTKKSR